MEEARWKRQTAYAVAMHDDCHMVMACLWAKWKDPKTGEEIQSCTILTTSTNQIMDELHNRMPVILDEADWPKCLGEVPAEKEELMALLKPCPDEWLKVWPVGKAVGNVRNKGVELSHPI